MSLAFSYEKLARTPGGGSWAVQAMLHCVSLEPGHSCPKEYRGLDRWLDALCQLIGQVQYNDPEQLPLYPENLDRLWEYYDSEPLQSKIWAIPSDGEFTRQMLRFFAVVDWDRAPDYIARDYELLATVEAPGRLDREEALAHVRDMLAGNELLQDWPLEFLGFDIIEWPSNWSVPGNLSYWSRDRWTNGSLYLNEHWLAPDWPLVDRLWRVYLPVGDPDFTPKDAYMYHPVAVISLGMIDRVRGRLTPP